MNESRKQIVTGELPLRRRLKALGLDVPTLHEVVRRGAAAKLNTSGFHPPSSPGYFQFAELVVAFREALCTPTRGWEPDDTANFCTVISPDRAIAIAVAAGDAATGDPTREPSTEHAKGPLTTAAVKSNQLGLFPSASTASSPSKAPPAATWWLLVAVSSTEVTAELSLPEAVSDAGWITSWTTRLILPPLPLDRVLSVPRHDDDDDQGGEVIDIDVTKRDDTTS